jgi:predicted MFS family arabinose efflux permease
MRAERYRRILAIREARQPVLGTAIERIPIAGMALATILLVRAETGSFAIAGAVEAGFGIATAVSFPLQGRLVDRLGQTGVLSVALALNPIALVGLVVAAKSGAGAVTLVAIGAVSGATQPATGSCMRALWSTLIPDSSLRQSAYALDAVSLEVAFISGPLITAALVASGSPSVAVLAMAALTTAGTLIFVLSRASRSWSGHAAPTGWAGPLRSRGILALVAVELAFGAALGAMEISITAFATDEGSSSLAGVLIAAQAAASLAAGLWYGSRHHESPAGVRYPRICLLLAMGFVPLLFMTSIVEALPLMVISGFALAPAGTVLYMLVDDLAPPGTATEAFTWMITSIAGGVAAGSALGGVVVTGGHPHRGFAATVVAAGLAAAVAYLARPALRPAPSAA